MEQIKAGLRRFIEDNFIMGTRAVALQDSDSFLENHVLDSTGFLELIAHLEEAYGIRVGDNEMLPENLDSLDNIAQFLRSKRVAVGA
ncbi:MAG: acyl carrier protein [Burkholderiales bacterium]